MQSLQAKILGIILAFLLLISGAFLVYAINTTENYRELRTNEISAIVHYECEKVNKIIAKLEREVIALANSGRTYYTSTNHNLALGERVVLNHFANSDLAIGGGIWYEPFAFNKQDRLFSFYACYDVKNKTKLFIERELANEKYNYPNQNWYRTIKKELAASQQKTAWTSPYLDDAGTQSVMTTVGAGIFDDEKNFIGMATVDWLLENVIAELSKIQPTVGSFVVLASPEDDYILTDTDAHALDKMVGKSLKELPWYQQINIPQFAVLSIAKFYLDGKNYLSFTKKLDNDLCFTIAVPQAEIFQTVEARNNLFMLIFIIGALVMLLSAFFAVTRLINRPLKRLMAQVKVIGAGNLHSPIAVETHDEIGMLGLAFNEMTVKLREYIVRHASIRAEKERLGAELNIATQIQRNMLPSTFPAFPERHEFEIFASMRPAREVGGDFYDFFLLDKNHLAIVVADVAGKGMPAALFMVVAKTLIKNNAQNIAEPAKIFAAVNNLLCENNEATMFVTAFMGVLEINTGIFTYANAGHNPPLIKRANAVNNEFIRLPVIPGSVLGGFENIVYQTQTTTLKRGDLLYVYTDGITEAVNRINVLFGESRLCAQLNLHANLPLKELNRQINNAIDEFANGAEQADDITMLMVQINNYGE